MRVPGWVVSASMAVVSLMLVSGCTASFDESVLKAASAAAPVAVPTCARPPCGGGPGSIRWSRALPTGAWTVSAEGVYRITQSPPPTKGSTNEVMPGMFGAGTASTFVLSLADDVLAFDTRTGAIKWSLPASRLPAHTVITDVVIVDGVVSLEVTQEFPTADWRYETVVVDLTSGRIQANIAGYHAGVEMATPTRAILENYDLLQGVDRATGRIVWTHRIDKDGQALVAQVNGRLVVSLPPKSRQARLLAVLEPQDGKTVDTIGAPHGVYGMASRGRVLYLAGGGSAYAYDAVTRKTLWRVALPVHDNVSTEIDPNDGSAYVIASLPRSPYTSTNVRVELSGRRTATGQPWCELRAATTVECLTTPSPTSRARGGPVSKPLTWRSPPIPFYAQLGVQSLVNTVPAGPGPNYVAGVSCPTSELTPRPGSSPTPSITVAAFPKVMRSVCAKPYLVAVNRT